MSHPPNPGASRRAICPREGFLIPQLPQREQADCSLLRAFSQFPILIFKGSLVDPRLRASNEHILIVRVPRARGRPGYPSHPSEAARCASTGIVLATSSPISVSCYAGDGAGTPRNSRILPPMSSARMRDSPTSMAWTPASTNCTTSAR